MQCSIRCCSVILDVALVVLVSPSALLEFVKIENYKSDSAV